MARKLSGELYHGSELSCQMTGEKGFFALTCLYLIALFPMIRANYNYIDDVGRALYGYNGWDNFSRYVSNFLSHIVHAGQYLPDISPVPQLIAVCLLVFASLLVIRQVREATTVSVWDLIAMIPLGLSPYFLECISYKYDSPYIALSIFISVLPIAFRKKSMILYCFSVVLCMLIMCMTYQAASGIFPMLVLFLAFRMWYRNEGLKDIVLFTALSALSYLFGIVFFAKLIMKPTESYVSTSLASFQEIYANYKTYVSLVLADFSSKWIVLSLVLSIWFIISCAWQSKRNRIVAFFAAIFVTSVMFFLSFGLYPVLALPLTAPRAMYGVGVFLALLGIGSINAGKTRWITRFLTIALSWCFIIFACTYGNALAIQDEYINFRMTEVIDDLSDLYEFNESENKAIGIAGSAGYAPAVENMLESNRMLARLVPVMFRDGWYWGSYKFLHYYTVDGEDWNNCVVPEDMEGWTLLQESIYHRIFSMDEDFVVELK